MIDVMMFLLIFFVLTASYAAAVQKVIPLSRVEKDDKDKGIVVVRPPTVDNFMIRLAAHQDKTGICARRSEFTSPLSADTSSSMRAKLCTTATLPSASAAVSARSE